MQVWRGRLDFDWVKAIVFWLENLYIQIVGAAFASATCLHCRLAVALKFGAVTFTTPTHATVWYQGLDIGGIGRVIDIWRDNLYFQVVGAAFECRIAHLKLFHSPRRFIRESSVDNISRVDSARFDPIVSDSRRYAFGDRGRLPQELERVPCA